jgi:DNA repair protein RadC
VDPRTVQSAEQAATIAREIWDDGSIELRESFAVLLFNTANKLIGYQTLFEGCLNSSLVDTRNIFQLALLANACSIIVVHNHPSGNPEPSSNDIAITNNIRKAGELFNIKLLDSLILLPGSGYTSLSERCLM